MKVLLGVLLSAYLASAAVYNTELPRFLGDLPVTKFELPGFVERNYTDAEMRACNERLGQFVNGKFEGPEPNYNILEILKQLGGAPGEVEAPKRNEVSESPVPDSSKRPLDDAPEEKWLYDYRATDYKNYYRLEHGVKRFPGTDKEFVDVRGQLAWRPEDTCGRIKVADYRQDDTGFIADLRRDYCWFGGKIFTCATIAYCNDRGDGTRACIG